MEKIIYEDIYWLCPVCNFEAFSLKDKEKHLRQAEDDEIHEQILNPIYEAEEKLFEEN